MRAVISRIASLAAGMAEQLPLPPDLGPDDFAAGGRRRGGAGHPAEPRSSLPRLRPSGLGYDVTRGDRRRIWKHLGKVLVHP